MSDTASFGEWIRRRRKALDLTREVLAQQVGCAVVTIRKIEADERRPSLQIAERLAECLQIPLADRAAFLQAARAELVVDRLPTPPEPPLSPPPPRRSGARPPRQQALKRYELQEPIGSGGFGVIYRARQPAVGREVAVKIIRPEYANHPEFIRRFEAEAQLVARLEHPHIVPLYDYWREPDGAYLVMRFVRGGSLHAALHAGPWALDRCMRLLEQIGAALAFAHRQGVVHRDLKPANILLDEEGNAYLADFGIAKTLFLADAIGQTQPGAVVGSPAYLSPEQLRDEPVTPRSDIYSLGVLLYEILTGAHPFAGLLPAEQLSKQLYEPLPPVQARRPDLPDVLNAVIQCATAKQPADRFPDVVSMIVAWQQSVTQRVPGGHSSVVSRPMVEDQEQRPTNNGQLMTDSLTLTDLALLENPYKGLRAFGEADAADFFGREALTQRLLERLAEDQEPRTEDREPRTENREPRTENREPSLVTRHSSRFLAVVGPSGSGKSSVVRAGLIPALRRGALPGSECWFIVEILPGAYPLEELEAALLRIAVNPPEHLLSQLRDDERGLLRAVKRVLPAEAETELLLVIDQFEELFTLTQDEAVRVHVLDSLRTAVLDPHSRLRVVVTLRADFYDRPLLYTGFAELVRQRTELVLPLTPSELEQAVVGPAARVGVALAPELVAAVVKDVGEQPGTLPLLQYALTELFERREGRTVTLAAYRETGGVQGALERRADEVYSALEADEQAATRQLFLRLITLGEGVEDTRRRVRRSEIEHLTNDQQPMPADSAETSRSSFVVGRSSALATVIERYGRARLLTFDRDPITREPTVEVAHEALIRIWGRLRAWLEASRADLRLQRLLSIATAEWIAAGRDPGYLVSGARLAQFEALAADSDLALNQEERAYVEESLAEREAQRAREATRAAHEARLERRARTILRALVVVLLLATLGALALTGVALNQSRIAGRNATQAQSLALTSGAQVAASRGNPDLALALALAANRVDPPVIQAQLALADLAYTPGLWHRFAGHTNWALAVAFSPDGKMALSSSYDYTLILWDLPSGRIIRRFIGHTGAVSAVAFSPDGKTALSGSWPVQAPQLILWDVASGQVIRRFEGHTGAVTGVAFSPNGKTALSASLDTTLILWDVASGQVIRRFEGHTGAVNAVAFSPDGTTALSGAADTTMLLWDVASGQVIRRFTGHTSGVTTVAFNPDGKTALSGSLDRTLIVWDVATGRAIRHLSGHTDAVNAVAFSPDGKTVLSGAGSVPEFGEAGQQRLLLWDVATGQIIRRFEGHTASVNAVAFSPDGKTALSGSADSTLILWGLDSGAEIRRFAGHSSRVNAVAFSPDGKTALSGSADTTLTMWDVASGRAIRRFTAQASTMNAVAFSPDGKTALSGAVDGALTLWDIGTGQVAGRFTGHTSAVTAVAFSPDGKSALSGSLDQSLILWDVAAGRLIRGFTGHTNVVNAVAFSPDGKSALSGSFDRSLILWDVASGQIIRRIAAESVVNAVAFSPDGKSALSGAADDTLSLWNLGSGTEIRRFLGHTGAVTGVAFSPHGKSALSGSLDQTLIVWDVASGQPIRRLVGHTEAVNAVAFSPDGRRALSGSSDKSLRLWRIDSLEELIAWTKANRSVPDLPCDQRALYGLEPPCDPAGEGNALAR